MPHVPARRPRAVLRAALLVGGILAGSVLIGAAPAAAANPIEQPCGGTSWWAGSTNVCDGTLVHRDYVNDDEGSDDGQLGFTGTQNAFGTLAHPAGDKRYPADRISSADLVRLELTRVGDRVEVLAETAALSTPTDTVLVLAIDSDGNAATGGGPWTRGPIGTLDANNGIVLSSAGWDDLVEIGTGDPATNTLRGSFALPPAATWRVQAVTAQAADRVVMNVAFRGTEEQAAYRIDFRNPSSNIPSGQGAWFEDLQAAALSSGVISRFGQTVATEDLQPGVERRDQVRPGLRERVYTSAVTVPATAPNPPTESMSYVGVRGRGSGGSSTAFSQVFNLLGKYQPYGVYVPQTDGPYGLQMEWHGSDQGIVAQINQPGMQARFGEGLGRLLVTPSSRGPNGYGSDSSERDLLDVMADVRQALPVDAERVFSSGYSQGGYIGFRMAMLYPDVFAGATTWVGFTGDNLNGVPPAGGVEVRAGAVGNMIDFTRNTRHVPTGMLYGREDPIVPFTSAEAMRESFAASESPYEFWAHSPAEHFTFAVADTWVKEAAHSSGQRLVRDPARVSYRTATFLGNAELGIVHDRAYWVSAIRPRAADPERYADTDLTSRGCGREVPVLTRNDGTTPVGVEPVPYTTDARRVTGTAALPPGESLTGTLVNVGGLVVDVAGSCLAGEVSYRISSDGPGVLTLSDGRTIALVAGENTGLLAGSAAPDPVVPEAPVAALLPVLALLAGGWLLHRRRTAQD